MTEVQIICSYCDRRFPLKIIRREAVERLLERDPPYKTDGRLMQAQMDLVAQEFRLYGCEALTHVLPEEEAHHDAGI